MFVKNVKSPNSGVFYKTVLHIAFLFCIKVELATTTSNNFMTKFLPYELWQCIERCLSDLDVEY